MTDRSEIAAVVIGRNEGERLVRCLASLEGQVGRLIYVDSGSTDGSVRSATEVGAEVVNLDMSVPFTAARGRNEGIERLRSSGRRPQYVQLVDGDCEVMPNWVHTAAKFLDARPDVSMVAGLLREKNPDASVYNRLAQDEWAGDPGEVAACGGIAMARLASLDDVGLFDSSLIAGEEPELCARMRGKGWKIWRLPGQMATHDMAMMRFSQWWQRSKRAGYAYAAVYRRANEAGKSHYASEFRRSIAWGLMLPVLIVGFAAALPYALVLVAIYPAQILRLRIKGASWPRAFFLVLGKFPEAHGALSFLWDRVRSTSAKIIEYK